jgi:hypothetical protein
MAEAGSLEKQTANFVSSTGLKFSPIFVLAGYGSNTPTSSTCAKWATSAKVSSPVLADTGGMAAATPMDGKVYPELCAVAPDMKIIACAQGHGTYQQLLDKIKQHAGK